MDTQDFLTRLEALEEQVKAVLDVTKAVAASHVKERNRADSLERVVKILIGDLPQQVMEKAHSPALKGDTSLDLGEFSSWAQQVTKEAAASSVPAGIEQFAAFASGQSKERKVPRT